MITRVRVVRFKRFADHVFDLTGNSILLAGPNNSGKTTLLHAIAAWNLALKRWLAERGKSGGKRRIGVVLDEFTALPLREMNLLWLNRHTARRVEGKKQPTPALAELAKPDEIHQDVRRALDRITDILPAVVPSIEANATPIDKNGVNADGDGEG